MTKSTLHNLRVALVQPQMSSRHPEACFSEIENTLKSCQKQRAQWVVLPEMFLGGPLKLSDRKIYANAYEAAVEKLSVWARASSCNLFGSIMEKSGRRYYNTLVWINCRGQLAGQYRKNHLFRFYDEHRNFSPGRDMALFDVEGVRVAPLVCYDLRFPELLRRATFAGAEMAIVCAQWPSSRVQHWITLLKARAIENQIFVVACNRRGKNHRGDIFAGASCVISPWGDVRYLMKAHQGMGSCRLDLREVKQIRSRYPFLRDSIFALKRRAV